MIDPPVSSNVARSVGTSWWIFQLSGKSSWVETPRDQTDKVIQLKTYGYHDMVLKSWKTPSYHPSYTLLSFHEGQTNWLPKKGHIFVTA